MSASRPPLTLTPKPASRRVSRWGEGPFWHEEALWYVDIDGGELIRFDPARGEERSWNMGQRVGFARPRRGGGLVWGGDKGLYRFDPANGVSREIPSTAPESSDHRYNDAGVAPDGFLFAGTISLKRVRGTANLYRLDADGHRTVAWPGVTVSNGIGWSPDGRTCYYIDTPARRVLRFAYADGELRSPQPFVDTTFLDASPDGLCVDVEGGLWIAFCHAGCVLRFDGVTGEIRARVDFPCVETTACAFGGPGLRHLYVTTGRHATREEPLGGRLFVVADPGVSGLPIHPCTL